MTKDPICYADVNEADSRRDGLFSEYNAQSFYFCSGDCKERFDHDPGAFMHAPEWEESQDPSDIHIG